MTALQHALSIKQTLRRLKLLIHLSRGALNPGSRRFSIDKILGQPGIKALSVDLFDTLLLRPQGASRYLPLAKAKLAAQLIHGFGGNSLDAGKILDQRRHIEGLLRREALARGLDPEFRQEEAVVQLLSWALRRDPSSEEIAQYLAVERQCDRFGLKPCEEITQLIGRAKAMGLRVIAISDMYLPGHKLSQMVSDLGIEPFHHIYASSDVLLTKVTGRLFEHVLQQESLKREEVVHIGDNRVSDVLSPRSLGIRAFHFRRSHEPPHPSLKDPGFKLGYEVFGPALTFFAHSLLNRAQSDGIEELAFASRDGFLPMKVFELLYTELPASRRPFYRYVHLSRRSTRPALAAIEDTSRLLHSFLTPSPLRPATLLDTSRAAGQWVAVEGKAPLRTLVDDLNLREEPFASILSRHRIKGFDSSLSEASAESLAGDPDFIFVLAKEIQYQTGLLARYLRGHGFFSRRKMALVDIGWRGHCQSALLGAFGGDSSFGSLEGYYFSIWKEFSPNPIADAEKKHGLVSDLHRARTVLEGSAFSIAYLLEAVCRAPEGTTLGYRESPEGEVIPVHSEEPRSREAEKKTFEALATVREGVLEYARTGYPQEWGRLASSEETARKRIQRKLFRLAFFPTREELELASRVHQTESASEVWAGAIVPVQPVHPLRYPARWLADMKKYPWRSGYMARTGGKPLAAVWLVAEATLLTLPKPIQLWLRNSLLRLMRRSS